jgi:hypothetical protein
LDDAGQRTYNSLADPKGWMTKGHADAYSPNYGHKGEPVARVPFERIASGLTPYPFLHIFGGFPQTRENPSFLKRESEFARDTDSPLEESRIRTRGPAVGETDIWPRRSAA